MDLKYKANNNIGRGLSVPEYLEHNLVRFVSLLRAEGLRIGSSEVTDGLRALQLVPLLDREKVRLALRATLVKSAAEKDIFDAVFASFFVTPELRELFQQQRRQRIRRHHDRLQEAEQDLIFRGESIRLSEKEKVVYAAMPPREKERMQDFLAMNEGRDTLGRDYRPFLETLVKGRLRFWHRQLNKELKDEALHPSSGDTDLDAVRDAAAGMGQGNTILTEDMQHIARKDLPQAAVLIRRMTRQLVARLSRRYRSGYKRWKPDLRATIRSSIQYGGTPFQLRYKNRRLKKPELLLLCDVSGSMIRYTAFVLQFIYGINAAVQRIQSFVFSDNLERITPHLRDGGDFGQSMAALVGKSNQWGGGTSLPAALQQLISRYGDEINRNTIVIIVSDTRTIRLQEGVLQVKKLKEKVRDIIWLNTLPPTEWDVYSSVAAFREVVTMLPCNTLADLEQVVSRRILPAK